MANKRIDQLTAASSISNSDLMIVGDPITGQMKRTTVSVVALQNVQLTLTDAATVNWNYTQGNVAEVTLGGNRTLSITNMPDPSFGILKVIQDNVGGRTLTLPGNTPTGFGYSTGVNQVDILGFYYDGTEFWWSIENYGTALPTLSAPGSFTATTISTTQINLAWSSVASATGYILQRADDAGFSTNLTTLVNGSNVLSFNNTSLTPNTTYYYRVKAIAGGFNDSSYSTANASTIIIEAIDWDQLLQTTDAGSGTINGNNTTEPAGGTATKKMDLIDGNYVEFTLSSTLSNSASLALVLAQNNDANYNNGSAGNTVIAGVFFFGSNYFTYNANTSSSTNSGIAPTASDTVRITKSGNDAIITKITGGTPTTIATKTGVFSGVTNAYIKAIFAVNTATATMLSCTGRGLIII